MSFIEFIPFGGVYISPACRKIQKTEINLIIALVLAGWQVYQTTRTGCMGLIKFIPFGARLKYPAGNCRPMGLV